MRNPVLIAALAFSLGACRERDESGVDTTATATTFDTGVAVATGDTALDAPRRDTTSPPRRDTTPPPRSTPDGTVLGAFIGASRHEVQHGKLAEQKASAGPVRDLGRTIARDHDDFVANAQELGKRLGITPVTDAADMFVSGHRGVMTELRAATGTAFDRIFLQHEIEYHKWLVEQINTTMLPRATTPEVKTFLEQALPAFQAHSKAAQDQLSKLTP